MSSKLTSKQLASLKFVNLHAHSHYSLLDGIKGVKEHYNETINKGHAGACITDHGAYASFFELSELSTPEHPSILGCELYIYDDRLKNIIEANLNGIIDFDGLLSALNKASKNPKYETIFGLDSKGKQRSGSIAIEMLSKKEDTDELRETLSDLAEKSIKNKKYKYNHIIVMAKSSEGHKNISRLSSMGYEPSRFYTRPRVSFSDLFNHKEGLVVASACLMGPISHAIFKKTGEEVELLELFLKEFGEDFYLEVQPADLSYNWDSVSRSHVYSGSNIQKEINDRIIELSEIYKMRDNIYFTQDSHMPKKEDKAIQDVIIKSDRSNSNGWHFYETYYIMSVEEMYEKVQAYYPEYDNDFFIRLTENTYKVLEKCKDVKVDKSLKLMKIPYDTHYINDPTVISERVFDELASKKIVNDVVDRFVYNDLIKGYLLGSDLPEEVRFLKDLNREDLIDAQKTHEQKIELDRLSDEITGITNAYKETEQDVQDVMETAKDDLSLMTLVRVAVNNGFVDFDNETYRKRFFSELRTISLNGIINLADYFMPFEEVSRFILEIGKLKGLGRGSGVGSLVCYALGITAIDPIEWNLLFERFLQTERIGVMYFELEGYPIDKYTHMGRDVDHRLNYNLIASTLEAKNIDDNFVKEELYYLECHPHIATYLLNIKNLVDGDCVKNPNNSHIAYHLGAASEYDQRKSINRTHTALPDVDYDSNARDEIAYFLSKKYGKERVAYIGIYSEFRMKGAFKDLMRAVRPEYSFQEVNEITKNFDKVKLSEEESRLSEADKFELVIERSSELTKFFDKEGELKELVMGMLGTNKSSGIHAGGVVCSPVDIIDHIPCFWTGDEINGVRVTQIDKDKTEAMGFVKSDFLGITTLDDIDICLKNIKKTRGISLTLEEIVKDIRPEIVGQYAKGNVISVFQVDTPSQHSFLSGINNIEDIEFVPFALSLIRPGPMNMGMHIEARDRINGKSPISYQHSCLEPYLKDTFGIITYQEQIMQIVQNIGGLSAFDADTIRRAMSKKKFKQLAVFEEAFIKNAVSNFNMSTAKAKEIWDTMASFAEYGFNKSHAVAYGLTSYACMYLKTLYPLEWISAVFERASTKDTEKNKDNYRQFQKEWGKYLRKPDISVSDNTYKIHDNAIYMPLYSIKGINRDFVNDLLTLKPFNSIPELFIKLKAHGKYKKTYIIPLILSGACDSLNKPLSLTESDLKSDLSELQKLELDFKGILSEIQYGEFENIKTSINSALDDIRLRDEDIKTITSEKKLVPKIGSNILFRKLCYLAYYKKYKNLDIKDKEIKNLPSTEVNEKINLIVSKVRYKNGSKIKEEFEKEKLKIDQMTSDDFVTTELDLLNFVSFDYKTLFYGKIQHANQITGTEVELASDIVKSANKTKDKILSVVSNLNLLVSMGETLEDFIEISTYLCSTYEKLSDIFRGSDLNELIGPVINEIGKIKNSKFYLALYYVCSIDNSPLKNMIKIQINSSGVLSSTETSAITSIMGNNFNNINQDRMASISLDSYMLTMFINRVTRIGKDAMPEIESYLSLIPGGQEVLTPKILKPFKDRLIRPENRDKIVAAFNKLSIPQMEPMKKETVNSRITTFIKNNELTDEDIRLFIGSTAVLGMSFKLPKKEKEGIREYRKGGNVQKMFRFKLSSGAEQLEVLIFDAENVMAEDSDLNRETCLNKVVDFKHVVLSGKFSINTRYGCELSFFLSRDSLIKIL